MIIVGLLALGVRLLMAGVILFSLFFKIALIGVREYRFPGWIPKWMTQMMFNWFYSLGMVLEASTFYLLVNIAGNRTIGAGIIVILGLLFTGYGLISLHKVGDCGCAGIESIGLSRNSSKAVDLIARNTLLFVGSAAALLLSPNIDAAEATFQSGFSIESFLVILLSFMAVFSLLLFRKLRLR